MSNATVLHFENVDSVSVLKLPAATQKYGESGKNGAEMNKIPDAWNKINLNSLIETVKRTGEIRWYENRIYFIEQDKCRNVYKAYQVSWINTNVSNQDDESY